MLSKKKLNFRVLPWQCTGFLKNKGVAVVLTVAKAMIFEAPKVVSFCNTRLTGVKNSIYYL